MFLFSNARATGDVEWGSEDSRVCQKYVSDSNTLLYFEISSLLNLRQTSFPLFCNFIEGDGNEGCLKAGLNVGKNYN